MAHEEGTTQPADEGPVERPVRPRAPQVDAVMQHVYEALRAGTQWQHEHIAAVEAALWQALDDERAAERERCVALIETYRVPVGNSRSGEMAAEWTLDALREVRDKIRKPPNDQHKGPPKAVPLDAPVRL